MRQKDMYHSVASFAKFRSFLEEYFRNGTSCKKYFSNQKKGIS